MRVTPSIDDAFSTSIKQRTIIDDAFFDIGLTFSLTRPAFFFTHDVWRASDHAFVLIEVARWLFDEGFFDTGQGYSCVRVSRLNRRHAGV